MMKTSLSLLAVVAAFAAQACAAPSSDDVSSDPMTPNAAPATPANESSKAFDLAGSFGERPATMSAGIEQPAIGQANAGEEIHAQLFVESRKQTYDVLDYSFGVASDADLSGAAGTAKVAAVAKLSDLNLRVQKKAGLPSFTQDLFSGKPIGVVTLRQRDAYGKYVDVAMFEGTAVVNVVASPNGSDLPSESVTMHMSAMRVIQGTSYVKVDAMTSVTSCSSSLGGCPCDGASGQLGPYVQTASTTIPIVKGAKRVDGLFVSVSNAVVQDPYAGMQMTKPQLDGIGVTSAFETSGMCAVYHAGQGNLLPSVKLGVGVPTATKEPRESTSWDSCATHVKSVSFSSRYDSMQQDITLDAAGLVRVDREWSATTGALTSSTTGWSFVKNAPIASCTEAM